MKLNSISNSLIMIMVINGSCLNTLAQGDVIMKTKYEKLLSAAHYINLTLRDEDTSRVLHIIVDNTDFAGYMAEKEKLKIVGKIDAKDQQQFKEFIEKKYVPYMLENEGKVIPIDFNDFVKFIAKTKFGNEKQALEFLESFIYEKPLNFNDLNVSTEDEMIRKYFDFNKETLSGKIRNEYMKYNNNPAFIALLLELRYEVYQGDIVPTLFIRKAL